MRYFLVNTPRLQETAVLLPCKDSPTLLHVLSNTSPHLDDLADKQSIWQKTHPNEGEHMIIFKGKFPPVMAATYIRHTIYVQFTTLNQKFDYWKMSILSCEIQNGNPSLYQCNEGVLALSYYHRELLTRRVSLRSNNLFSNKYSTTSTLPRCAAIQEAPNPS